MMYYTKALVLALFAASAQAFTTPQASLVTRRPASTTTTLEAVKDVTNEVDFDKTIQSAGGSLVVVDYSTTWCGPCKVIAPKTPNDLLSEPQ